MDREQGPGSQEQRQSPRLAVEGAGGTQRPEMSGMAYLTGGQRGPQGQQCTRSPSLHHPKATCPSSRALTARPLQPLVESAHRGVSQARPSVFRVL